MWRSYLHSILRRKPFRRFALLPRPTLRRGAFVYLESVVTYLAYLDEFGHVGPYIDRQHPQHNDSPVFGFAGLVLPVDEVRGFGTWFFQRKCQLLEFELARSGKHPALWEKKGSTLYTVVNVERYRELRRLTLRIFNKIEAVGGFVLYVGVKKTASPACTLRIASTRRSFSKRLSGSTSSARWTATRQLISFWRLTNTISEQR